MGMNPMKKNKAKAPETPETATNTETPKRVKAPEKFAVRRAADQIANVPGYGEIAIPIFEAVDNETGAVIASAPRDRAACRRAAREYYGLARRNRGGVVLRLLRLRKMAEKISDPRITMTDTITQIDYVLKELEDVGEPVAEIEARENERCANVSAAKTVTE